MIGVGIFARFRGAIKIRSTHDTWYYLLVADKIRKSKRLPKKVDHFLFDGDYDYPPILPKMLSLVPKRKLEKYGWVFSPSVELLHMLLLFIVAQWVTGNLVISLMAMGIYAVTPILVWEFTTLNSRSLGSLFFSACVVSLLAFSAGVGVYFLIPAILFGATVLLTHKMATQTLFFLLAFFSIWEGSLLYLAFLGLVVGLAVLVSKGFYLKILKSHYTILNFWRKNISSLSKFDAYFLKKEGKKKRSVFRRLLALPRCRKIYLYQVMNLWVLLLVISLVFFGGQSYLAGFSEKLMVWGVFIFGLFLLTTYIPPIQFLGEGERYFEYGALPISVVVSVLLFNIGSLLFGLLFVLTLGVSIGLIFLLQEYQLRSSKTMSAELLVKIFKYIKNSRKQNVMCVPIELSYPTAYFTRKKVLFHDSPSAFEKGKDFFPVPTKPLSLIADKHDIYFVLVDNTLTDLSELDLKNFKVKLKENRYFLLERANR